MSKNDISTDTTADSVYQPPAIEEVLKPSDMKREVAYAGLDGIPHSGIN
ncbi:MAG: hypothetical protein ACRD3J_09065 [Thermoanaerobaculia bacterium]